MSSGLVTASPNSCVLKLASGLVSRACKTENTGEAEGAGPSLAQAKLTMEC